MFTSFLLEAWTFTWHRQFAQQPVSFVVIVTDHLKGKNTQQ